MKRALLVGIDSYANFNDLHGCVNDVEALHPILARNEDNTLNLTCEKVIAPDSNSQVSRDELLGHLERLLAPSADFALLYFAGHGSPANGDVYLVTSDATGQTPGVRFAEVLELINRSEVPEVAIVLDCCFSGGAATIGAFASSVSHLRKGVSILTASRDDQVSAEVGGRGAFSLEFEAALEGGAADVLGHVNVAGLYSYISEVFGPWEQRPTFKANVDKLHDIRRCDPRIAHAELMSLTNWFPDSSAVFPLDPSYEPTEEPRNPDHEAIFASFQRLRACRLLEPVGEEHLYYAAMHSTGARLTTLGRHYWEMVYRGLI